MVEGDEIVEEEIEESQDIETLQKALADEKEKAEKYLSNWQRSQADLENWIKRAEREKSEIIESANRMLILDLLPILDDFERALASPPVELDGENWTEGIRLIYNRFKAVLETYGLAEIKAEGEQFDPQFHEAVGQVEGEEGTVVEELRKGYKFRGKLLRPSMVMVGKENKDMTEQESSQEEQYG